MAAIPNDILNALKETFVSDPGSLARIIYFLSTSLVQGVADPYIHSLQGVLQMPDVFTKVAERMANDTKTAEEDPKYRQFMQDIWSNFLKDNLSETPNSGQTWALAVPQDGVVANSQYAFMRAVANLPPESFVALQGAVEAIAVAGPIAVYGNRALNFARSAGPAVKVGLVVGFLAWDILKNIRRWWNGEITGVRCVKNIIDNGISVAAGVAGGVGGEMLGAAIGSFFGPLGTGIGAVAGAIGGSVAGATAAQALSDRLTQWFFGLPKSEALENAYGFLQLPSSASNSEINSRYRQLALQFHPDKGGDPDKWTQLQYSLAVIREARGEH